jgi:hypothetical protein
VAAIVCHRNSVERRADLEASRFRVCVGYVDYEKSWLLLDHTFTDGLLTSREHKERTPIRGRYRIQGSPAGLVVMTAGLILRQIDHDDAISGAVGVGDAVLERNWPQYQPVAFPGGMSLSGAADE